jgi:hypothetical protein
MFDDIFESLKKLVGLGDSAIAVEEKHIRYASMLTAGAGMAIQGYRANQRIEEAALTGGTVEPFKYNVL